VPSEGGKVTPGLFDRFKARIAELTRDPNTFWTDQFNNADALDGYANIGQELVEQVGRVDAFVGGVGTGGMLMGVSRVLKARDATTRIVALGRRRRRSSRRKAGRIVSKYSLGFFPPPGRGCVRRSACNRRERRARHGASRCPRGRNLCRHVVGPEPRRRAAIGA
jgi:cysteine synthase A